MNINPDFSEIEQLFLEFHLKKDRTLILNYIEEKQLFAFNDNQFFSPNYQNFIHKVTKILPALSTLSIFMSISHLLAQEKANIGFFEPSNILYELSTIVRNTRIYGQKLILDLQGKKDLILFRKGKRLFLCLVPRMSDVYKISLLTLGVEIRYTTINYITDSYSAIEKNRLIKLLEYTLELFSIQRKGLLEKIQTFACNLLGEYSCSQKYSFEESIIISGLHGLTNESTLRFYVDSYIETLSLIGAIKHLLLALHHTVN